MKEQEKWPEILQQRKQKQNNNTTCFLKSNFTGENKNTKILKNVKSLAIFQNKNGKLHVDDTKNYRKTHQPFFCRAVNLITGFLSV